MGLDKNYLNQFIKVTEFAAYGAAPFIGKGNKNAADQGAVDNMRNELNKIDMTGTVVIGEGEMDEAPMLHIGEKVGTKKGIEIDIALDPLEGTKFTANNLPGAFSVLVVSEKGNAQIQGRLILDENERLRAKKRGIKDLNKKYNISDMVKGDIIFCATGVTDGDLDKGIIVTDNKFEVNTLALHQSQKIIKKVTNTYKK